MIYISYVLCAFSWKKGSELLRNFYDLLQSKEPLTTHGMTSALTSSLLFQDGGQQMTPWKNSVIRESITNIFVLQESSFRVMRWIISNLIHENFEIHMHDVPSPLPNPTVLSIIQFSNCTRAFTHLLASTYDVLFIWNTLPCFSLSYLSHITQVSAKMTSPVGGNY